MQHGFQRLVETETPERHVCLTFQFVVQPVEIGGFGEDGRVGQSQRMEDQLDIHHSHFDENDRSLGFKQRASMELVSVF